MDKFEGINYKIGKTGSPMVLDNAVAYLEAKVIREVDVGSHTIFIGEVLNADIISTGACMIYDYYRQIKGGLTPKAAATYIEEKRVEGKRKIKTEMAKYKCSVCGYI